MILTKVFILLSCGLFLLIDLISAQSLQTTTSKLVLPPQCFAYTTINDASRNVNADGNNDCDTLFMSGSTWFRFIGGSGTQISITPTNSDQCGTQVTGWYSGTMPAISETITNGRVCFSWLDNTCQWSNTIGVTNCGSFYIYQLTMPPVCAARYCTDTPNFSTATSTSTTLTTPALSPQCYEYTTIDDPTRNVNQSSSGICDRTFFSSGPTWVRFVGTGGTQIPTSAVGYNRCGADATGWYTGAMPSVLGATKNGTVCFEWQSSICQWNINILVTNCGSYYVYLLTAPSACSLRYCTDTTSNPTITTTEATTSVLSSQCYEYTTVDDPTRNVNQGSGITCDQALFSSGSKWIRFVGAGGTQIPTSAVGYDRCGTQATGWYSGAMPSVLDTTTNGTVCFEWQSGTCQYTTNILVTNCGSFYVYQLHATPGCGLRYCTDTPSNPTATTAVTTIDTTTSTAILFSSQCYNYTTIDDPTRNVNQSSGSACDKTFFSSGPTWVRFVGTGGTQIPTSTVGSNLCGTQATGWYLGEMPNVLDTTTSGTVCFEWQSSNCKWNTSTLVTNCGSYYVYQLGATPDCNMRYCTTHTSNASVTRKSTTGLTLISSFIKNLFKKLIR